LGYKARAEEHFPAAFSGTGKCAGRCKETVIEYGAYARIRTGDLFPTRNNSVSKAAVEIKSSIY
jgi:hypothetical protein